MDESHVNFLQTKYWPLCSDYNSRAYISSMVKWYRACGNFLSNEPLNWFLYHNMFYCTIRSQNTLGKIKLRNCCETSEHATESRHQAEVKPIISHTNEVMGSVLLSTPCTLSVSYAYTYISAESVSRFVNAVKFRRRIRWRLWLLQSIAYSDESVRALQYVKSQGLKI